MMAMSIGYGKYYYMDVFFLRFIGKGKKMEDYKLIDRSYRKFVVALKYKNR